MHKATKYQVKRHQVNFTWLWEYLLSHPCIICTESDPTVLEFHHRENNKSSCVSAMVWNAGLETLKAEVDKCDVLCANCHKRLHSSRAGHAERYGLPVPAGVTQSTFKPFPKAIPAPRPLPKPYQPRASRETLLAAEARAWIDRE